MTGSTATDAPEVEIRGLEKHFAQDVAERVVFMDGGRIVEEARPDVFFSAPRTDRARAFLGRILERESA